MENEFPRLKTYKKSFAYQHVFNSIKEEIISGATKPGDRLPSENDLCYRLGIGRSAVREGLRELEALGLIRTVLGQKGGRFVNQVKPDIIVDSLGLIMQLHQVSFDQYMDARKVVESAAAEMAALNRTEEDLKAMLRALTVMRRSGKVIEVFFQGNYEFHKAMVGASKNTVLYFIIQALRKLVLSYFDLFTIESIQLDKNYILELHNQIYEAVKERESEKARKMTLEDLDDFCLNYQKYYRKFQEAKH